MNTSVEQLSTYFTPDNYKLHFDFSQIESTQDFKGSVVISGSKIHGHILKFHAIDLEIASIDIDGIPADYTHSGDILTIESDVTGNMTLSINFSGVITDAMHGIYPSYFEEGGNKKKLFATQFESHHAREAFPCIDEPAAKATFELSYMTPDETVALSNMPQTHHETSEQGMTYYFDKSPRMSTYLLALVFGDLQSVTQKSKNGIDVSIYSTPVHNQNDLAFALDCAVRSIDFFEEYFSTPYPLLKCDHIALPDFSSGAMENWGLITYRESCLIASPAAAISTKELVATVIAHETSHQWFGNLVTMKWWDELWLNESFANMMEYVAVDALFPEWEIWNEFTSHEVIASLRRDQLSGVQAVHTDVNHPDEISTLFDPAIVYAKGSRLIKMLRSFVGEDAWQTGLKNYFKDHAYSNTSSKDLWDALGNASNKNVSSFMSTWLNEPGYPVVSVLSRSGQYELTQERFILGQNDSTGPVWNIPLAATDSVEPILMSDKTMTVSTADVCLPINSQDSGHYIAQYDAESQEKIYTKLASGELNLTDRLTFLHEQSLLARSLRQETADLLPLIEHYQNESAEPVWGMIAGVVSDLKRFVEDDETAEHKLKSLVLSIATPLYRTLGLKPNQADSDTDTKLRALILSLLVYTDFKPFIEEVLTWYRVTSSPIELPAESRSVILSAVSRYGTDDEFASLVQLHDTTHDPELRDDISSALCMTREPKQIKQLIDRLTDKSVIRPQDTVRWYVSLLRNREARYETWQWLITNWDWVLSTYKGDKSYDSFARYSASVLAGTAWLSEYDAFFSPKEADPALARTIAIGRTELQTRTEWIEAHKARVIASLMEETK